MKLTNTFLFLLIAFVFTSPSYARVLMSLASAPKGWTWQVAKNEQGNTVATLVNIKTGEPSIIQFAWSPFGVQIVGKTVDDAHHLIVPKLNRTSWAAHPGTMFTLEEIYLDLLRSMNFEVPSVPFLLEEHGETTVSGMEDFLAQVKAPKNLPSLTKFINSIVTRVQETNVEIFEKLLPKDPKEIDVGLAKLIKHLEVIEPIRSTNDHGGIRYDAFNLLPLRALVQGGADLPVSLQSWSKKIIINPLLVDQLFPYESQEVRLAMIALLTHNHLAEKNFIRAIVLRDGVNEGWLIFKALNDLYAGEQNFWTQLDKKFIHTQPVLESVFPSAKIDFLDRRRAVVVSSDAIDRLCSSSMMTNTLIPIYKSYHLYGGFVLAKRLQHFVPDFALESLTSRAAGFYKLLSKGNNVIDREYTMNLFKLGASYARQCN